MESKYLYGGDTNTTTPPNNQKDIDSFFSILTETILTNSPNVPSDKALGEIAKELGYRLSKLSNVKTYGNNTDLRHPFSFDVLFKCDGLDTYVNTLLTGYHTALLIGIKNVAVYTKRNRFFKQNITEMLERKQNANI